MPMPCLDMVLHGILALQMLCLDMVLHGILNRQFLLKCHVMNMEFSVNSSLIAMVQPWTLRYQCLVKS